MTIPLLPAAPNTVSMAQIQASFGGYSSQQLGSNVSLSNGTGAVALSTTGTFLGINNAAPASTVDVTGSVRVSLSVTAASLVGPLTGTATGLAGTPPISVNTINASGAATLNNGLSATGGITGNLSGTATGLAGTPAISVSTINASGAITGNVTGNASTATSAAGLTGSPDIVVHNATVTGALSAPSVNLGGSGVFRVQFGTTNATPMDANGNAAYTFPTPFVNTPVVFLSMSQGSSSILAVVNLNTVNPSRFFYHTSQISNGNSTISAFTAAINWVAFGL